VEQARMTSTSLKPTVTFLAGLEKNNAKVWFDAHRADYDAHWVATGKALVEALAPKLHKIDGNAHAEPRIGGSIFRINRDVRFSKDKSPYKTHLDLWFWTGATRDGSTPGYFVRITPREFGVGAGMHHFESDALKKYRAAVGDAKKGADLAKIIASVKKAGLDVGGVGYKKVPRGFEPDHPRAELLKHDSLHVYVQQKKVPATIDDVVKQAVDVWKKAAPITKWLGPVVKS
jgi:uncharacterized protein (TIGR02453 family)